MLSFKIIKVNLDHLIALSLHPVLKLVTFNEGKRVQLEPYVIKESMAMNYGCSNKLEGGYPKQTVRA
jgi:hypothetical protein